MLFDLDGTLVDSFPGIASAYHHVLKEMGIDDVDDAQLRQLIGPPIQVGLQRHFGLEGTRLEEGIRIFRAHYGSGGLLRFEVYPGIDEMLGALRDEGFELFIATSKLRSMATEIVEHAGWTDHFTAVGGAEPDGSRYLKKDVMVWTIAQVPSGTRVVAMVGDRADDAVASRELGVPVIGVTWGYGSVSELHEAGVTSVVNSPAQLIPALVGLSRT